MKVKRVVMCLNSSPTYSGMWDIVAEVYEKTTDIIPTLVFCGTEEELANEVKSNFGEVHLLKKCPSVITNENLDWSVTWSCFWAMANFFPNDVCCFQGIDEIPMSTVLWDKMDQIPTDKYIVGLGSAPYGRPDLIASGYNCAKGSVYKNIYNIEDDLEKELKKVWNNRYEFSRRIPENLSILESKGWWGLDEAYISSILYDRPEVVFFENEWVRENLFSKRICRSQGSRYDRQKIKDGYYWSVHIPRPLSVEQNKDIVKNILKDMGL